jgi:acyl-CoA synthetase (AMP-forming)/AMP-acid ligase II
VGEPIYEVDSIWDLVARRAERTPERTMLVDQAGTKITFGAFARRAEELAAGLFNLGVKPATVVSWQLPTRIDTVVLSAALARLGAVQNPILHIYRQREVAFVLSQMAPELFFVPGSFKGFDYAGMAAEVSKDLEFPPTVVVADAGLPEGDPDRLPAPPAPSSVDEVRWVYYTSGTTSDPKGVRHTDRTLLTGGRGLAMALELSDSDVGSIAFPFAHIAGPDYLVMMLALGFSSVIVDSFVPTEAVEIFSRYGVTMAGGSTAFYLGYLAEQRKQPGRKVIPTLRLLSGGGAPMPPEVFDEVRREIGVKVTHGYGMTEIPMITMGSPGDTDEQLANTVGKPVYEAQLRIAPAEAATAEPGTAPGAAREGEVRVRGPMVCKGYTGEAQSDEVFDEDGWLRTGDLGYLRPDGHLVLTGRLKDVIIRKGENISAKEVEDLLYTHPKVGDVAVVGLPDPARGERVCAVVETAPQADPITFEEMVEHLRAARLMEQKVPEQLEVVDSLPRNETLNKVLKYKLREQYSSVPFSG